MNKMENEKKNYRWLKLDKNFFTEHYIIILEGMPNGKLIVYFYLKLLAESIGHNGYLRFSDEIPYNNEMLAALTGTDVAVVTEAMKIFKKYQLVEVLEDETINMMETEKMLGLGSSTERVRHWREKKKLEQVSNSDVTLQKKVKSKMSIEISNDELFNQFWEVYPRKVGKDKCQSWFKRRKVTQEFVDDLIIAINNQVTSIQWKKDASLIPHPYTWLNRGGWNDELAYDKPLEQKIKDRWKGFLKNAEK